jgi:hypothetical protein
MQRYTSGIALVLPVLIALSPARADVTAQFYNDGPDEACVEYSYIPTGQRLDLQLLRGMHYISRVDALKPANYSQVQVYTVQTGAPRMGAMWQAFPSTPVNSELVSVIFLLRGRDAVVNTFYSNGTSLTGTAPLSGSNLPCPSPK